MNRFERKFKTKESLQPLIEASLIEYGFSEIFYEREITSIYYDTPNFLNFMHSENGNCDRQKIRIRFYNDDFNNAIIEYKNKKAELGWKNQNKLSSSIYINSKKHLDISRHNKKSLNISIPELISKGYRPTIVVNYLRKYFLSMDNTTRITLDKKINFSAIFSNEEYLKINPGLFIDDLIIEVKYDRENEPTKILQKLTNSYELIMTRYSKYCKGIRTLF